MDSYEKKIITFISTRKEVFTSEIEDLTGLSRRTVNVKLNNLINLDIIIIKGNKYNPNHTYSMK